MNGFTVPKFGDKSKEISKLLDEIYSDPKPKTGFENLLMFLVVIAAGFVASVVCGAMFRVFILVAGVD